LENIGLGSRELKRRKERGVRPHEMISDGSFEVEGRRDSHEMEVVVGI
jgi:hypothetical protein